MTSMLMRLVSNLLSKSTASDPRVIWLETIYLILKSKSNLNNCFLNQKIKYLLAPLLIFSPKMVNYTTSLPYYMGQKI